MTIYCIGNLLIKEDSLPLQLLPKLQKEFPDIFCFEMDPTENFIPEEGSILIDTVQAIKNITVFSSLEKFADASHVSAHDYDLLLHLKLLKKIGKVSRITIIGIPYHMHIKHALRRLIPLMRSLLLRN